MKTKILLFCLLIGFMTYYSPLFSQNFSQDTSYYKAEITSIDKKKIEDTENPYIETTFYLKILEGKHAGETKSITYKGTDSAPQYVKYKLHDRIFIGLNKIMSDSGTDEYVSMYDVDNSNGIIIFASIFVLSLLVIAKFRGFVSLLGLSITVLLLFFVFVPLTMRGFPPLISAVAISLVSIFVTIPIITGLTRKTIAGIIGASSGVFIAVIMTVLMNWTVHMSGIISDELMTLFYASNVEINLKDIALSGMIISALGAVIDVSVSIASSVQEIFSANAEIDRSNALKSAMKVGRDNLGSMVNTLIMSYVGSSLSLILLISLKLDSNIPLSLIINNNEVLVEILKSFAGCMGMLFAVPITAVVGVRLFHKQI